MSKIYFSLKKCQCHFPHNALTQNAYVFGHFDQLGADVVLEQFVLRVDRQAEQAIKNLAIVTESRSMTNKALSPPPPPGDCTRCSMPTPSR